MELLLGAVAGGGGGLFSYNRENYMFDKELSIKRDYQAQEMRVRQVELYREDLRDLVNLTVRKMDNYLIVNVLQLGFCMTIYVEGRPEPDNGDPIWLIHLFAVSNVGAFMYYLLSVWLAMHASVAAHAFGVRLLTQFVRLPIPDDAALDKSKFNAQQYEAEKVTSMLRIPLLKQQLRRLNEAMVQENEEGRSDGQDGDQAQDEYSTPVTSLEHVQLYRQIQANWQSYDAYARVCMAMGTNQLLHTLSYTVLGSLVAQSNVPWPAFCCVLLFTTCAWVLARLDLYLSRKILAIAATLLIIPPMLVSLALTMERGSGPKFLRGLHRVFIPVAFGMHLLWIIFTVLVARAVKFGQVSLPTNFRSVLFLDVFGWLSRESHEDAEERDDRQVAHPSVRFCVREHSFLSGVSEEVGDSDTEAGGLPEEVRPLVIRAVRRREATVRADLQRWETSDVQLMLRRDNELALTLLRQLRENFDEAAASLAGVEDYAAEAPSEEESSDPVWLSIEWDRFGTAMPFFYQCESGRTLWEMPEGSVRISDMQSLQAQVQRFLQKARWLQVGTGTLPTDASGVSEAAVTEDGSPLHPVPTVTFHPTGNQEGRQDEEARRMEEQHHLRPGRLPWLTVKQGSMVLMLVWLASLLWSIHYVLFQEKPLDLAAVLEFPAPEKTVLSDWPPAFSNPVAIACSPGLSDVVVVAEKYSAHVLNVGQESHAELQAALDSCLSAALEFQVHGFRGLSLHCDSTSAGGADGNSCEVLFLGSKGHEVLRCPLQSTGRSTGPPPEQLQLLGGPWQSIAGGASQMWAVRQQRSSQESGTMPVRLRHGVGATMLPELDLAGESEQVELASLATHRSSRGLDWLLALTPSKATLHAWPLGEVASWPAPKMAEWHLPEAEENAMVNDGWLDSCSTGDGVYFLSAGGPGRAAGKPSLWRTNFTDARKVK